VLSRTIVAAFIATSANAFGIEAPSCASERGAECVEARPELPVPAVREALHEIDQASTRSADRG